MKRVIVVGGSSGIGRELAILYAKNGHRVGVSARRNDLLESLQALFPERIVTRSFDVTNENAISELQHLIESVGGMDLLILSAGKGIINTQLDVEIERQTAALNVMAWTALADFTFNYFKHHKVGQLAAITSIAAIRGEGRVPAYNASKAYQANYLEGLRKLAVHKKLKISITDIQPGFVKTDLAKGKARFWEATAEKAARQIYAAIEKKKRKAYITKRWWLIAQVLKITPGWIFNRI